MSTRAISTAAPATLTWTVHGLPAPQGSARAFLHRSTHRVIVTHANHRTVPWRQEIAAALIAALSAAGHDPHAVGPLFPRPAAVKVQATFYLPRPKSLPKRFALPASRPDLDKLVRAALDSMTGLLFADDSQAVSIAASKAYGAPRAEFTAEAVA